MVIRDRVDYLSGRYVNSDLQYPREDYLQISNIRKYQEKIVIWKNDKINTQISLASNQASIRNIEIEFTEFKNEEHKNFNGVLSSYFIDSTQAYSIKPNSNVFNDNEYPPKGYRKEANEILSNRPQSSMSPESILNIWVNIESCKDTLPGIYTGDIYIHTHLKERALIFPLVIEVLDIELSEVISEREFDIEFWQNPYAVAEYYEVEIFSEKHFQILKPHMKLYKAIGGRAITTTIVDDPWDGQTYSKNEVKYPSMIKWIKKIDGSFEFDYEHFDKWIKFNLDLGIGEKISCYSIVPWNNAIRYYDEKKEKWLIEHYDIKDNSYLELWEPFLNDFVNHVTDKKWFKYIYIGIDERGFHQKAFDLINHCKNEDGETLKISGALDNLKEKEKWADSIDDLTMGTVPIKNMPEYFADFCESRKNKGLKTTVYSCTGHVPGNFSLSAPGESFWTILFSYFAGADGFLRWAFDSWVENPILDTTHRLFEAGDCFLIYPGDKDDSIPKPQLSTRLEKISEGVRTVNKLSILSEIEPNIVDEINKLKDYVKPVYSNKEYYLDHTGELELSQDMYIIRNSIINLTKRVLENKKQV